jgi:small subunit ribosomal protein S16
MSIVIRMSRQGRTNRPHFRIGVWDVRSRRDGPPIEYLGHYDPLIRDDATKVTLDGDRVRYWLEQGAYVTDSVRSFLVPRGIRPPDRRASKRASRKARKVRLKKRAAAGGAKPAAKATRRAPKS